MNDSKPDTYRYLNQFGQWVMTEADTLVRYENGDVLLSKRYERGSQHVALLVAGYYLEIASSAEDSAKRTVLGGGVVGGCTQCGNPHPIS